LENLLAVVAGEHDVFHVACVDAHKEVHVVSGKVSCERP
jgi:hypothetical protein